MSVPALRRFLRGLSDEEWGQVIAAGPAFGLAVSPRHSSPVVDVRAVKKWVQLPAKSDPHLATAVFFTAAATLVDDGEALPTDASALPTDDEAIRSWLTEVAERRGPGPAKVCLLAAREASRGGPADLRFGELLTLIDTVPFVGPPGLVIDSASEHPAGADPADTRSAPRGGDGPPDGEPPAGDEGDLEQDLVGLRGRVERLRVRAQEVTSTLEGVCASVVDGGPVDEQALEGAKGYSVERRSLLDDIASLFGNVQPETFGDCLEALEQIQQQRRHAVEERDRRSAIAEAEQLRGKISTLIVLLADHDDLARADVEAAIAKYRGRLAQLEPLTDGDGAGQEIRVPNDGTVQPMNPDAKAAKADANARPPEGGGEELSGQAATSPAGSDDDRHDGSVEDPSMAVPVTSTETSPFEAPQPADPLGSASLPAAADRDRRPEVADASVDPATAPIHAEHSKMSSNDAESGGGAQASEGTISLIREHRPAAASWVAAAADPDGTLTRALRFNAAAYASGPGSISPTDAILLGTQLPLDLLRADRPAALAVVAGAARAGLAAGWTHRPLLADLLPVLSIGTAWQDLFNVILDATQQGYIHMVPQSDVSMTRMEFGERAAELRRELQSSKTKYNRATRVLQHLLRDDGPLGTGLHAVTQWSTGSDPAVEDVRRIAGELTNPRARDRLINDADTRVSSSQQRRNAIEAGARQQLESRIEQVADLLSACLDTSRPAPQPATDDALRQRLLSVANVAEVPETIEPLGAALLAELLLWVRSPDGPRQERGHNLDDLLLRASLPLSDAARDDAGYPQLLGLDPSGVADRLLSSPPTQVLVESYIERGNLSAARAAADLEHDLLNKLDQAAEGWAQKLARRVKAVEDELARVRASLQLDIAVVSSAEARLRAVGAFDGDRFDLQEAILAAVVDDIHRDVQAEASRLTGELDLLELAHGDERARRIRGLIESGDLAMAREYLFLLGRGQELPPEGVGAPTLFEDFVAFLRQAEGPTSARDVYDQVTDDLQPTGTAQAGLNAWSQVVANPQRHARDNLDKLLALLGLDAERMPADISERGAGAARIFEVKAEPLDGSVVAALGSRSGRRYYVTVVDKERIDPRQVLGLIPEARQNLANLILVPQSLSLKQRKAFLKEARQRKVRALLVDSTCVGFLAAREPGSFRALQQITLPFATYSHYTPFVAGDVPREVFVGRAEEAEQIVSPTGSLFVYGGRQLGKSALLRHIAATHSDGLGRHAIYVDLKAKMIGEAQDPAHLWVVLLEEFKRAEIIGPRVTSGVASTVTEHVRNWLLEDETRRVLLLLDEADLFLESEARQRREGPRFVRFANISPLKSLMEETNRRFKPVFAGLHQVQRFHEISNTPLAHGGSDILIGPLDLGSAFDLVERPMTALGYRFESRDLVARLLAFANYQASLIQIVCNHLIEQMSAREPKQAEPPFRISGLDVDAVLADDKVRKQLAERLRWTIALEDRYLVIALVVAVLSLEHSFALGFEANEILSWCRSYWPGGFSDMSSRDFALYLEELEGLGVLVRRADGQTSVRSPNIVAMLGTKAELEQQLEDGAGRFELPHDYNPRVSRRTMRRGAEEVRSPLTEQDLQVLLPKSKAATGISLIAGSAELGIGDVPWVLGAVAAEREKEVLHLTPAEFGQWVTDSANSTHRGRAAIPVIDAVSLETADLDVLLAQAKRVTERRKDQAVIVVAGPPAAYQAQSWSARVSNVTLLERWTDEGLRSWSEGPFGPIENRERILAVTSGWPSLVRTVASRSQHGESLHEVIESIGRYPDGQAAARDFLEQVGADRDIALLAQWADITSPGENVDPEDLEALLADDLGTTLGAFVDCANRMQAIGVISGEPASLTLDAVVHRALRAMAAPASDNA